MSAPANVAKFHVADLPVDTKPIRTAIKVLLIAAAAVILGILVWQGVTAAGNPDPTKENTTHLGAIMDIGVLVFREGLETILVLAAITASMTGEKQRHRRPVVAGAGVAFAATVVTWFIAIGILHDIGNDVSALNLQAATGLLAVVVLLVVMNWFFHKIYWGGWISMHNRRKKELLSEIEAQPGGAGASRKLWWGLALLGFASLYREGFEVVLFLQGYYLKMGSATVLTGAAIGVALAGVVAVLTFVGQRRLPYRKMLIFTGILLGVVLLVMVGEQAFEMQQANWLATTNIAWLQPWIPDWAGVWFSVYPTVQTLVAQALAAALVIGSYYLTRRLARE